MDLGLRQGRRRQFESPVGELELGDGQSVVQIVDYVRPTVRDVEGLKEGGFELTFLSMGDM